ncbi:MAG: hypothetical protein LQ342_001774 [Letrouitia transgressa]|nr:MAG: hypothetical protein LQ342_001774 [Letrouitia transgressa]
MALFIEPNSISLFEYLAASKNQDTTEIPGPSSFTSALIYALKSLSDEKEGGRFTTAELSKRIRTAPEFPKAQIPMLEDREDGPDRSYHDVGRIILHPLEKAGTPTEIPDEIALAPKHVLTLHFEFGGKPPDDNLTVFTSELRNAYEGQNIGLRRVRWGGERATTFARATRWFERGLNKRRESTRKQRPSQIDLQRVESSPAVSPNFLSPQSAIINHQGPACTNTPDSSPLSSSGLEDEYPSQKKKRRF